MIIEFMKYYKPYRICLVGVVLGTFIVAALDLLFPMAVKYLLDHVFPTHSMSMLFLGSAGLLGLYLFSFLIQYLEQYYGHKMSAAIEHDMRRDLFAHIERLSFRYFDNEKTGQLLSRITGDITEISDLAFRGPNDLLLCAVLMVGTLFMMLMMNWKLALLVGGLLIFKSIHTVKVNRLMKNAYRNNRAKAGEVSARAEESLSGIRLIKAFAKEKYELTRFIEKSNELKEARYRSYGLVAYFIGSINFFTNFINVVVLLAGGTMIAMDLLTMSDFVAFLLYVNIFMRPVFRLTILVEVYQRGMAGFHRFKEIMDTVPEIVDTKEPLPKEKLQGDIVFDHVSFCYAKDKMIIQDLSLKIKEGQTVAFVGETGAGKSTLVNLLLRFYEPSSGVIHIGGQSIDQFRQQDLREKIGIVQQDVFLFSDTISENISYGKEHASADEIVHAAKNAAAHEFIEELPEKYETKVGERGIKLSGGQKQRIAIARVFIKDPPYVIFDEATSSLDNQTEKRVQETLDHLAKNRTTIIIAHRLSTVQQADCIFVLDHGQLIEQGNHEQLLSQKGKYYELYEAQKKIKKEE